MTGLGLLAGLTVLGIAWALRAYHLDLARERRRVARLRAVNADLRAALTEAEFDLDLWRDLQERAASLHRHPSQNNVRVLRSVDGA